MNNTTLTYQLVSIGQSYTTDNIFLMFGGRTADGVTDATYIGHCTKSTIVSISTNQLYPSHLQMCIVNFSDRINNCLLGRKSIHHQEQSGLIIDVLMPLQY